MKLALALACVAGCTPGTIVDTSAETGDSTDPVLTDFRDRGPFTVTATDHSQEVTLGCDLDYALYEPASAGEAPLVVLAHGLQRTNLQMSVWADHLASWGFVVAAPTLCTRTVLDIDHERNGRDLVALAGALGGSALYAGHSAGGLASIVAAALDPDAVALFGLDPVDSQAVGADHAPDVDVPYDAVVGFPAACNAQNNVLPLLPSFPAGARALAVTDADHCDFEEPSDALCDFGCGSGSNDRWSDEELGETILGLMTANLAWRSGLDADGESWWDPDGEGYAELLADGVISAP